MTTKSEYQTELERSYLYGPSGVIRTPEELYQVIREDILPDLERGEFVGVKLDALYMVASWLRKDYAAFTGYSRTTDGGRVGAMSAWKQGG